MARTATSVNHKQTANLNITEHTTLANRRCVCLVQPKVVEQNNDNTTHRLMKAKSTHYCHHSSCKLNGILRNNYNIKSQQRQKCPLTLGLVIVVLLAIVLTQMPTMVNGKAVLRDVSSELRLAADAASLSSSQTSAESNELLSSSSEDNNEISAISSASLVEDSSSDSLTALDVLKHIQRTQQHQQELRKRHRKRHISNFIIQKYLHENSNNLEWYNPCNGVYQINQHESIPALKRQYLENFQRTVKTELLSEFSTNVNRIQIADKTDWSIHEGTYSFLPKINRTGHITLRSWYRNMQTYVASFGYLARTQYKFEKIKQIGADEMSPSRELNELLTSARRLLCELETTINGSIPINQRKLKTTSRATMNERLKHFQTKHDELKWGVVEANMVDLKFTKKSFINFVSNMNRILNRKLNRHTRKHASIYISEENQLSASNSMYDEDSSSINNNSLSKTDSRVSLLDSIEAFRKSQHKQQIQIVT